MAIVKPESAKLGNEVAVLVRSCNVTGAIDTTVFETSDAAKIYCETQFCVPRESWYAYEIERCEKSPVKLNGEPVRFTGWKKELADSDLDIQLRKMVVEF